MLCEKCRQREATVHKQVIINGVSHSEHLCAECAARERRGRDPFASFFHNDFFADGVFGSSLAQMLAPFFQADNQRLPVQEMAEAVDVCPECGMSWDDFQRNGFLGCDACYDHFKDALPPLMQRLHSDVAETIPAEASAAEAAPVSAKAHLESELQRAIAAENFEEAAQLRDAIRALEAAENGDGSTDGAPKQ